MDYLSQVERLLDMSPAQKLEVMRELRSHYEETREKLMASGIAPAQAAEEAARQLGDPKETALRLNPVHGKSSWPSAVLAIVPFLVPLAIRRGGLVDVLENNRAVQAGILAAAVIYAAIVLRELIAGRRPVWLATWLAAGIGFGQAVMILFARVSRLYDVIPIVLFLPLVVVPVCWKAPKWRRAALAVSSLIAVPFGLLFAAHELGLRIGTLRCYADLAIWSAMFVLGPTAAWVVVGLRAFATHRYGHPMLASLYLYSYWLTAFQIQSNMRSHGWELARWESPGLRAPEMLLAAVPVVVFCRASSWRSRLAALVCGIFAWAVASSVGLELYYAWVFDYLSNPVSHAIVAAATVIAVPLVMMRSARADRPEVVQ